MSDKESITGPSKQKTRTMRRVTAGDMFSGNVDMAPKISAEEKLRKENPGLEELWEQYQTMLKLLTPAKEKKESPYANDVLELIRSRKAGGPGVVSKPKTKLHGTASERIDQIRKLFNGEPEE